MFAPGVLADRMTVVARGAGVDRGGAVRIVLRHMRGRVLLAATFDKIGRVVGFVGPERLATHARQLLSLVHGVSTGSGLALQHLHLG